ncbi:MAG: hypothetical protein JRJ06_08060 [Deltaproteobacteria bacterium]|nr:hypothetical protein [Deltaproteobacteria bacterium]
MKRKVRLIVLFIFMAYGLAFTTAAGENNALSINEGADTLASSLTEETATKYFDAKKRPVIKVAVFDFTDRNGDVTVGSRYISNRIKLAFGSSPQFALLSVEEFEKSGSLVYAEEFEKNNRLRDLIVGAVRADVYIFGKIDTSGGASVTCQVDLWGIKPPFDDFSNIGSLKELKEEEKELKEKILSPLPWRGNLSSSGLDFFNYVLVKGIDEAVEIAARGDLGEVIFLSQPICDDLNLSWQVRADGMVYDVRKESDAGTLRSRTGQIMQGRVKDVQTLKELSYIIKNFRFVIKETNGVANSLESYMIPTGSDLYFVPYQEGGTGLRFMYLWSSRGRSKNPSAYETGKGWKVYVAEQDYRNVMPVGTHTATATLEPIAESEYGTKKPRAEYVSRFKFAVKPGLNIYVINYVYRRDRPEIFVRRLEIEGSRDEPVKGIKRITEIYRVYGEE